jgi:xylulokinase
VSAGAHIPVLLDADDRPLRPAILWSDLRATAEADDLHARAGETVLARSLNKANATWTLPMLAWIGRHEPAVKAETARLCLAKDYVRLWLTGAWHTDFSDVVGALMADVATGDWSAELAALAEWPVETLPPVVPATQAVGGVTAAAAEATGLMPGTPVVCGANDTTAELLGAGVLAPGGSAIKLATAGVLFHVVEGPVVNPPISCYPHAVPGLFYLASGTNACASAHRWARDLAFPEGGFAEMERLAAQAPPGSGGLLFHPYLQGERAPYWDPMLRGDFVGLTMRHDRRHLARAVYEGLAFSIRDLVEQARDLGPAPDGTRPVRLLGGGAAVPTWRQIVSDVTGLHLEVPESADASFGAALLAGLGVGAFPSPADAVAACVRVAARLEPDPARHAYYGDLFRVYREAQRALAPIDRALHALEDGPR